MCCHMYRHLLIPLLLFVNLGFVQASATENRTSPTIFTTVISNQINTTVIRNGTGLRDNAISESDTVLTNDVSHLQHSDLVANSAVTPVIRNSQTTAATVTTKAHEDDAKNQMSEDNCDGLACAEDEFCSRQWQRCRACEEIKIRCRDLGDVHSQFPACEAFCIRLQMEEAERVCTAEKLVYQQEINQLNQSLAQTDSALNKTRTDANEDRAKFTGEQDESRQKLTHKDILIKQLENNLTESRKEVAKYREELNVIEERSDRLERELTVFKRELTALKAATGLLGLLLLGAFVTIGFLVKRSRRTLKNPCTNTPVEHRRLMDERPVPVEPTTEATRRTGINLGFGADKLLPGGARSPVFLHRRDNTVPL